jgi:hypothetical protein
MKETIFVVALVFALLGCDKPKPAHSYVFNGYTTTEDGSRAYEFESDEMEGSVHLTYSAICVGHQSKEGTVDGDCQAIKPYLHRMLPPTYATFDGHETSYLDIPSLNLEFEIVEAD